MTMTMKVMAGMPNDQRPWSIARFDAKPAAVAEASPPNAETDTAAGSGDQGNRAAHFHGKPRECGARLLELDDDLALGTACFDVGQRLAGRFKGKDPIDHRL